MAFNIRSLIRTSCAPWGTLRGVNYFFYATEDLSTDLTTAGYFNEARDVFAKGDVIRCNTNLGADAPDTARVFWRRITASPQTGDVTHVNIHISNPAP